MVLLFLEFLGTSELIVIALVALIIFGPRKLPDLGRSLGKSLGEFKRASEDFKRTWEREVEVDRIERDLRIKQEIASNPVMLSNETAANVAVVPPFNEHGSTSNGDAQQARTIARGTTTTPPGVAASEAMGDADASVPAADAKGAPEASRKQDWL